MATKYDRINDELSPPEVNEFLLDKFGVSLFKFAQVFSYATAKEPFNSRYQHWRITEGGDIYWATQDIKKAKHILIKLKRDIIQGITSYISVHSRTKQTLTEEWIISAYCLNDFFRKRYDPLLKSILNLEAGVCHQGIDINQKSLVAAGWGNLLHKNRVRVQWRLLVDLYYWIWKRIEGYDFYGKLEPTADLDSLFPIQYQRHRNHPAFRQHWYLWRTKYDATTVFAKDVSWGGSAGTLIKWKNRDSYWEFVRDLNAAHQKELKGRVWFPLIVFPNKSYFTTLF